MEYRLLSYPLNKKTPTFGEMPPLRVRPLKRISRGDSCNISSVSFPNHLGTHIDAPRHFFDRGRPLSDYPIADLIFTKPGIVDCPKKDDEFVTPEDLIATPEDLDLLLISTEFSRFRGQLRYQLHNPGLSPLTAEWLRANRPQLKALGIDAVSVSAFQRREEGREAHRILLRPDSPILLIEDLDLSGDLEGLTKVFAVPLLVEGVDSMPCTVFGEFR